MRSIASYAPRRALISFAIAASLSGLFASSVGMAATEANTTFMAHYEHRAQIEAELSTLAQSYNATGNTDFGAVVRAVTECNQNITKLYTIYQALAAGNAGTNTPRRMLTAVRKALSNAKHGASVEIQAYTHKAKQSKRDKAKFAALARAARKEASAILSTNQQISSNARRPAFHSSIALQMTVLQLAIEQLQATVIDLLNAWLWLADPAWASSQPATATDLAYTNATVTIPAMGAAPNTDAVGVEPQVTDASGQALPDMGWYVLQGPTAHQGVFVDALTGTVTVRAHATPGTYFIVYRQGKAVVQATIQVEAG